MSNDETISGIADHTVPNMGRIYDYFLGGHHNFEVDRIYAAKILETVPMTPKLCRLVRWFLGAATRSLAADGFSQFMDFASGLPVEDHIHRITPPGTRVLYSDNDPITVAYAEEILGDTPDVLYLTCDVFDLSPMLQREVVASFFDRNKKTAVGLSGITYFMADEKLRATLEILYDWARPGDRLYLCDSSLVHADKAASEIYAKMGNPLFWHSEEQIRQLAGKWRPVPPGFRLLEEWIRIEEVPLSIASEEKQTFGGNFYGVIFEK